MSDDIKNAERQINSILADLEATTGCLVQSIELRDIEITAFGDERAQLLRGVRIELKPLPGTRWQ